MKRIHINNEFTQWAEYLARYFGEALAIYDNKGDRMWGDNDSDPYIDPYHLSPSVYPIYKDIGEVVAYYDIIGLTAKEVQILKTIIPFIESQLDDEGA
jgi:hypothetical protein